MRYANLLKAGLAAAALSLMAAPTASAAGAGVHVGMLECRVDEGWGHIVASSRDMNCVFNPVDGGREHYRANCRAMASTSATPPTPL